MVLGIKDILLKSHKQYRRFVKSKKSILNWLIQRLNKKKNEKRRR